MRGAVFLGSLAIAACGGTPASAPPTPVGPPASMIATPAGASDLQVATVNGRPVFASCVTAQAARGISAKDALQECIDFELLAQAAAAHAGDPEVQLATRTALVSQLVAREYEDRYQHPADFGAFWERAAEKNKFRFNHGEGRASLYVRILLPEGAPAAEDAQARAISEEIAARLATERGLTAVEVEAIVKPLVGTRASLELKALPLFPKDGSLVAAYEAALFGIPEVGRASGSFRTRWGWDVVVLTDLAPEVRLTPQQIAETMLPDVKRAFFTQWANQVAASLGVKVQVFEDAVKRLEDL